MTDKNLIETVAQAIFLSRNREIDITWGELSEQTREYWRDYSKAAIEAYTGWLADHDMRVIKFRQIPPAPFVIDDVE